MSIDAAAFKKGMRHLAASVTLITTRHRDLRGGLTATAVCSVSAEPPQILVCVNKTASAHDPIGEAGFFCVNILCPEPSQDRRALRRHGRRRGRRALPRHGRVVDPHDRRAGAEGLPGVVRLQAGDRRSRPARTRSISARSSTSRSIPKHTAAALCRRHLRARRGPEEGRCRRPEARGCAPARNPLCSARPPPAGASPSGKAEDFDSSIPRFESWRPSQAVLPVLQRCGRVRGGRADSTASSASRAGAPWVNRIDILAVSPP